MKARKPGLLVVYQEVMAETSFGCRNVRVKLELMRLMLATLPGAALWPR